jgi:hypothetical protein
MKIRIASCIIAALFLFSSASIWEGSAAIDSDGYLPAKGPYAATKCFPRNTVIEITNLENNKRILVIVAEDLENSGLLALVSQDVAEKLEMSRDSKSRIRMTQPSDSIAYKWYIDGMAARISNFDSGAADTEEKHWQENQPLSQTQSPAVADSTVQPLLLEEEWGGTWHIEDLPAYYLPEETLDNDARITDTTQIVESNFEPEQNQSPVNITETLKEPAPGEFDKHLEYSVITAEERPPETSKTYDIDLNYIIPGITRPSPADIPRETIEIPVIAPIPASLPPQSFTINPISRLERGSYYVQIASLSGLELVESALDIINASVKLGGENFPNYQPKVYKDDGSWYRILLGPLNQGESGAILQRFRSIGYKDSFVRQGR